MDRMPLQIVTFHEILCIVKEVLIWQLIDLY